MFRLSDIDRGSPTAKILLQQANERLRSLEIKCGTVQDSDPAKDMIITNLLRGQIKEVKQIIKGLKIGQDDASALSVPEDESPQN